jgi:hypothetical protein
MTESQKLARILAALFVLCFGLWACGSHEPSHPSSAQTQTATPSPQSKPTATLQEPAAATDKVSVDTADVETDSGDAGEDSDKEPEYFHGYRCTDDCSGHQAGYDWAEEHDIDDVDQCGGNSQSFIEGCQAWVEENH